MMNWVDVCGVILIIYLHLSPKPRGWPTGWDPRSIWHQQHYSPPALQLKQHLLFLARMKKMRSCHRQGRQGVVLFPQDTWHTVQRASASTTVSPFPAPAPSQSKKGLSPQWCYYAQFIVLFLFIVLIYFLYLYIVYRIFIGVLSCEKYFYKFYMFIIKLLNLETKLYNLVVLFLKKKDFIQCTMGHKVNLISKSSSKW